MAKPFCPASETQVIIVQVPGLRGLKVQVGIIPIEGPAHTMSSGMCEFFERALPVFQSVPRYLQLAHLFPPEAGIGEASPATPSCVAAGSSYPELRLVAHALCRRQG